MNFRAGLFGFARNLHIQAVSIGSRNLPTGPMAAISHVATSLGIPRSRWAANRYRAKKFSRGVSEGLYC